METWGNCVQRAVTRRDSPSFSIAGHCLKSGVAKLPGPTLAFGGFTCGLHTGPSSLLLPLLPAPAEPTGGGSSDLAGEHKYNKVLVRRSD